MLSPHDRENLTAALAPPTGFVLDAAVGTAFTLDLEALLTVPIAVALFGADTADTADEDAEPVGLLEAIRRHTDQITMFCQAGQIALPRRARTVFAWLEDAVIEVQAPRPGRLFHPKLWVLRYARPNSDDRLLRVLVPTRNLTFDTSWDTLLALDSAVWSTTATPAHEGDDALAALVAHLPKLATGPVDGRRRRVVESLAEDCRHHALTPPTPFSQVRFHALGLGPTAPPPFPPKAWGAMVISPFLGDDLLRDIADRYPIRALVSREDALDRTDQALLDGVERVAVLNDVVALDGTQEDEGAHAPAAATHMAEYLDPGTRLSGLHAKLYVFDTPHQATWLTGSANATSAAFDGNVEVLAELKGPRHQCGTTALLADTPTEIGFDDLLMDHRPIDAVTQATAHEQLQHQVDDLRRQMASVTIRGTVAPDGADLSLTLMTDAELPTARADQRLRISVWPVTLQEQTSRRTADPGTPLDVTFGVTLEGLSAFIGVRLDLEQDDESVTTAFVTRATLTGIPEDRSSKLLAAMLRDPQRLLRYLLMLLQSDDVLSREMGGDHDGWLGRLAAGGSWDDLPILERLVQSVDRHPDRLDHFDRVMTDLGEERDTILPPQFMAVWLPVWQARNGGRA